MCGIVAALSNTNIVPFLIQGLRHLEYRGYDSAGLAVMSGADQAASADTIQRVRAVGRVAELDAASQGLVADIGIAHTRWATHGAVTQNNAHPHFSSGQGLEICLVHNGIIENHQALRAELSKAGYRFISQTDTEVVAHLLHQERLKADCLIDALHACCTKLQGAYALAVLSSQDPNEVAAARLGAPLLVGLGRNGHELFLASDASALLELTHRFIYLEDGDRCLIQRQGQSAAGHQALPETVSLQVYDKAFMPAGRAVTESSLRAQDVALGPYRHFMQKEIAEQPGALAATLEHVMGANSLSPELFGVDAASTLQSVDQVLILACGTSYHSGLVAKYWVESLAGVSCHVEIASEYRYRQSVTRPDTLVVAISQSGETADTLAAIEHAKANGVASCLAICNVAESSLIRACNLRFLTRAGPEIGVASTKAFTTQLAALFLLALVLGKLKGKLSNEDESLQLAALRHLPAAVASVLLQEDRFSQWASQFVDKNHCLFLGRGLHYPIALEGALKLKEISYIHAEAYAAGELKHGPLALVDRDMPVVAVAPNDQLLEKLKSNLEEVRARGGRLYVVADQSSGFEASDGVEVIALGDHAGLLSPILHVVPLQLLAYHVALARGHDVDKPRNLAKSVTVE
ncbi:MAG: glutamine--fructose-6-phosphate transaminase (isomerizing) [Burkholderiaceae bacterium]|jgi:glucosamine--fructose-6-phosphate aminotransferase (isomerizing)